jgi:hypothetical protein
LPSSTKENAQDIANDLQHAEKRIRAWVITLGFFIY